MPAQGAKDGGPAGMHQSKSDDGSTPAAAGVRRKVPTYCFQCFNGPDLMTVEVVDGVATKVEPNFCAKGVHPADGKICVKPYGLIQKVYNPNRLLQPMKRTNPRKGRDEDPGWVKISWDEALDTVAARLRSVRERGLLDEHGDPRLAFTTGAARTPLYFMGAFPAFFGAWGGPIDLSLGGGGTGGVPSTPSIRTVSSGTAASSSRPTRRRQTTSCRSARTSTHRVA